MTREGQKRAGEKSSKSSGRVSYARPKLIAFGDIRDVTLGSSPGVGESGNPTVFRP